MSKYNSLIADILDPKATERAQTETSQSKQLLKLNSVQFL